MKQKLHSFAIHQAATSLQRTDNLNLRTRWYPVLDETNHMTYAYFIIHLGLSSSSEWFPVEIRFKKIKSTCFTSSTFPIQADFSQNQPAAITLNTCSPRTLDWLSIPNRVCSNNRGEPAVN